jgi:hypothetical protein
MAIVTFLRQDDLELRPCERSSGFGASKDYWDCNICFALSYEPSSRRSSGIDNVLVFDSRQVRVAGE